MPYMTRALNQGIAKLVGEDLALLDQPIGLELPRRYWNFQYTPKTVMVWMGTLAAPIWLHDEELAALEAGLRKKSACRRR